MCSLHTTLLAMMLLLLMSCRYAASFTVNPTTTTTISTLQQQQQQQQQKRHLSSSRLFSTNLRIPTRPDDAEPLPEVQIVTSMPEPIPLDLKNDYFLLRHGQSTANVAGIISSARSLAYSSKHGLTPMGYRQGFGAAEQLLEQLKGSDKKRVVFVSSPFARAYQTAQACLDGLSAAVSAETTATDLDIDNTIIVRDNLMERYFGRLDDEAIYTYAYVWPVDKFNVTHTAFDVESVAAVSTRLRSVVMELEDDYDGANIVLVSHADVLQICQLYGANVDNVGIFSSYRFANGEVRRMARTPNSLPDSSPLEAPDRETKTVLPEDDAITIP